MTSQLNKTTACDAGSGVHFKTTSALDGVSSSKGITLAGLTERTPYANDKLMARQHPQ
jgi:hypothetical protein